MAGTIARGGLNWPKGLADLGKQEPKSLWYEGNWKGKIFEKCAAVVGSRRMTQYGRQVLEKMIPLKKWWLTQASMDIARDAELLDLMQRSGCIGVFLGIESFGEESLRSANKRQNKIAYYQECIEALHRHGIAVMAGFIAGFDSDTPQSILEMADRMGEIGVDVAGGLDGEWVVGKTYALRLSLFGFLPAGEHRITLASIDRQANLIESKESGALAPVWNHTIRFAPLENGKLHYTDGIEIQAGLLTGIIWAFAHLFYRHRQRRWKMLLHMKTQNQNQAKNARR